MNYIITFLRPYKKQCILGPFCKWMEAVLELILPTIMAFMINDGILKHDMQLVIWLGLTMIAMVIIGFLFSLVCQYQAALASQGFGTDLRNALFAHIADFSYQDIEAFSTASLNNRLSNDIQQLQIGVAMMIRLVIRAPFIVIGALFMAMLLDIRLSLILLAIIPFISLALYLFIRYSTPLYQTYQRQLDHLSTILGDQFSGIRLIRSFVSAKKEQKRTYQQIDVLQLQLMKLAKLSSILSPSTALIVNAAIALLLSQGVIQLQFGDVQAGTMVAFINYANSILLALIAMSNIIVIFTKAWTSAKRVAQVLDYHSEMLYGENEIMPDANKPVLQCSHVSYTYGNGEDALTDISFTLKKGETLGIIGPTGSGKTTLAHLLCRFYDVTKGEIFLYGQSMKRITKASLRANIGIVSQINELFSGTIEDVIRFGAENNDAFMKEAIQTAQLNEFINELSDGLQTKVEYGGMNFSGGQRQRLSIARAIFQHYPILILDDSSSALDYKTDALLKAALQQEKDMTKIIISQRVATLLSCDHILVLQDGHLVGDGGHKELYDSCEVYRNLCISQEVNREVSI